ncbi:hypothetical protein [Arthrobacter koreensis]|uniref:hypothetical protein n=1 Tax=Arthrobacter koreensis TaxID=199136 RepID=UPI002DBC7D09|nr:hypothetical protein [Arthrobacter koreensis]MEB7448170.1 hypothetical protein [Arthrobacter koreensis]
MSRAYRVVASRVYMAESAPDRCRGFFGSFLKFRTTVGFIRAAIVCTTTITLVGDEGMLEDWWRLRILLTAPARSAPAEDWLAAESDLDALTPPAVFQQVHDVARRVEPPGRRPSGLSFLGSQDDAFDAS